MTLSELLVRMDSAELTLQMAYDLNEAEDLAGPPLPALPSPPPVPATLLTADRLFEKIERQWFGDG